MNPRRVNVVAVRGINTAAVVSYVEQFTSGTIVLGRLIGSSLVESFTNSYTLTDPNGTEEKYT